MLVTYKDTYLLSDRVSYSSFNVQLVAILFLDKKTLVILKLVVFFRCGTSSPSSNPSRRPTPSGLPTEFPSKIVFIN